MKVRTKPIANQYIKNNAVPPALVEIWQHVAKGQLQNSSQQIY